MLGKVGAVQTKVAGEQVQQAPISICARHSGVKGSKEVCIADHRPPPGVSCLNILGSCHDLWLPESVSGVSE